MLTKVICVVRGPIGVDVPPVDGLHGYSVVLPSSEVPAEHPDDVGGVASVWIDGEAIVEPLRWFPGAGVDAYRVEERVQIDYERDWPDGQASPGFHRIVFVRRAPGITREQMAAHWSEQHTPLVRQHHPAFSQYVQNVVLDAVTPGTPDVDGVAEMHFRSLDELRDRFYDSEDGRRIIAEDVDRFLDRARGWRILGHEHWVVTPRTRSDPGR